jgi:hypothetical protein
MRGCWGRGATAAEAAALGTGRRGEVEVAPWRAVLAGESRRVDDKRASSFSVLTRVGSLLAAPSMFYIFLKNVSNNIFLVSYYLYFIGKIINQNVASKYLVALFTTSVS